MYPVKYMYLQKGFFFFFLYVVHKRYHQMHLDKTRESCQGTSSQKLQGLKEPPEQTKKKQKKKHSPVSLCESACHKDAPSPCPLFSMTALLRRRHPRGAEGQTRAATRACNMGESGTGDGEKKKKCHVTQGGNELADAAMV